MSFWGDTSENERLQNWMWGMLAITMGFVVIGAMAYAYTLLFPAGPISLGAANPGPTQAAPVAHQDPNWWYGYAAVGYILSAVGWSIWKVAR